MIKRLLYHTDPPGGESESGGSDIENNAEENDDVEFEDGNAEADLAGTEDEEEEENDDDLSI